MNNKGLDSRIPMKTLITGRGFHIQGSGFMGHVHGLGLTCWLLGLRVGNEGMEQEGEPIMHLGGFICRVL